MTIQKPQQGREICFDKVFDILLTKNKPYIFEIGMTRIKDNIKGDGYSTPMFAYAASLTNGTLISVDIDENNKNVCEKILTEYGLFNDNITLVVDDAINVAKNQENLFNKRIDFLYLDAQDQIGNNETKRISEDMHLLFFQLIESYMNESSYILIDDVHNVNTFDGKGKKLIPYLLNEWDIVHKGYQFLFRKK